jgi:hypothetical protein
MTVDMEITAADFARRANQRKRCPAPRAKIIIFASHPNHTYNPQPSRTRQEGRIAIVTDVGRGMRWTRQYREDERC